GETSPTVAIASERLRRKKAGASDRAQVARRPSFVSRSKTLRGVFDNGKAMRLCDGIDLIHVSALSIERHRHDRARSRSDGGCDQLRIEIVGARIDIYENRLCAENGDHLPSRNEGKRRRDYLIARTDTEGHH